MHSTSNLEDGYLGSGTVLRQSIIEHGTEHHSREVIEICESRNAMIAREREIVNDDLIADPLCMNIRRGGYGGFDDVNKSRTHQQRANAASRAKQRELACDPVWSQARSKKMTHSLRQQYATGSRTPIRYDWTGKRHSEETKTKIGRANQNNIGDRNGMFGRVWVFHEEQKQTKSVPCSELEQCFADGWQKGRKMNFKHVNTRNNGV